MPDPYLRNRLLTRSNLLRVYKTSFNHNHNHNPNPSPEYDHNPDCVLKVDELHANTCELEAELFDDV